jgi:glycosyltransferase involved in cell wall biosynthesis
MKVAVDAYYGISSTGGIARYVRGLVSELIGNAENEEFILFINRFREKGKAWRPTNGYCQICQICFPKRLLQGVWNTFAWPPIELFCGSIDLFHGLHFVLPPSRSARKVLTVHDLTYLKYPEYYSNRNLNERGYHLELPQGLQRADAVIAVSKQTRDDLIELMNFPEDKIRVIYEGVEPRFLNHLNGKEAGLIRKHYGLNRPYLAYLVGTPEPRKNLKNTIAAAKKAAPNHTLALIGPQKSLTALSSENFHNTMYLDIVPEEHLPAILSGAVISLYPSLYEGFGLPVIESMACGAPVITSNNGALKEVAGEAARLVDPRDIDSIADGISDILNNEVLRHELHFAGIKRAAEFTWQKAAEKTLSLYKELI